VGKGGGRDMNDRMPNAAPFAPPFPLLFVSFLSISFGNFFGHFVAHLRSRAPSLCCLFHVCACDNCLPRRLANGGRDQVEARAVLTGWHRHFQSSALHGAAQHTAALERHSSNHRYFAPFVRTGRCQRSRTSVPGTYCMTTTLGTI